MSYLPVREQAEETGDHTRTNASGRLRCGTLVYTKASLVLLFACLLWGDLCVTLTEIVGPNILPLMLKAHGTPNVLLSLVMTTIPSLMNFVLNPIISTASDRYRGRLGRRIPFLLFSAPFIVLFLVLLGFSEQLGAALHSLLAGTFPTLSEATVVITVICTLMVCFLFFEFFVTTVFWYLFNDVVPTAFLGRFVAFSQIVGTLSVAGFKTFILQYATSHATEIFTGIALLYAAAFLLIGITVKEGKYPPPKTMARGKSSPVAYARTFFKECFSHRIFCLAFLYQAMVEFSTAANIFLVFMAFSIGLTLGEFGKVAGLAMFVSAALMYPMGSLVDRFHPLRIIIAAKAAFCLATSINLIFLFHDFSKSTAFWIYASSAAIAIPVSAANKAAGLPMLMRLFPHERFGQFCSANFMCGAVGKIMGGILVGFCLDKLKPLFPAENYYYRFVPLWNIGFTALALLTLFLIFRQWKKLGGDHGYHSPIDDSFKEFTSAVTPSK